MAQDQHRTTNRILDILEHLSTTEGGMTLTQLSQTLETPKSSLFPIVHTLKERRYLQEDHKTGRYTIGPRCLALGAAFAADESMEPIFKVMKHVVSVCQETCQFGILDQGNVLYVGKEDSTQAIRMISWVGNRLPANATAIGKALLSGLTDDAVRALYPRGLPRLTEHTISDMDVLLAQLDAIRNDGIATEQEESTAQLACWAVPLRRKGTVFAALSVSVPLFRCKQEKIDQVCRCLREARVEIEQLADIPHFPLTRRPRFGDSHET
ncbi:MAG: IclR family transcriptional regulator [Butyricicoccus sp.]|nr:IclR family transcriptional regulator [Butyricicoccus sp.]